MKATVSRYSAVTRWLLGPDFFISYARADGQPHAEALANALSGRRYTRCIDTDNSRPGALPLHVLLNLKRASVLAVLASPAACASKEVAKEIAAFPCGQDQNIVLVRLCDQAVYDAAVWAPHVRGLPRAVDGTSWKSGPPPAEIEDRLVSSVSYLQENVRQKRTFYGGLAALGVMVAVATVAGVIAWWQVQRALAAEADARAAESQAREAQQRATAADQRALEAQQREETTNARASAAEQHAAEAQLREKEANEAASSAEQRAGHALEGQQRAERAEHQAKERADAAQAEALELTRRTRSMRLASQVPELLARSQAEGLAMARRALADDDNPSARRAALEALLRPRVQAKRVLDSARFESVAWSDHDALVATTTDGSLALLDGSTFELRATLPPQCRASGGALRRTTFSREPETRVAAVSRNGQVIVWDWGVGRCWRVDPAPGQDHVSQLAWNADGSRLAASDYDGYVRVWNAIDGQLIGRCKHREEVQGVLFHGRKLVSATAHSVVSWTLDSDGSCAAFEPIAPALDEWSQPVGRGARALREAEPGSWFIATADGFVEHHPHRWRHPGGSELEACATPGANQYVTWERSATSALAVEGSERNVTEHPLPMLKQAIQSVSLSCWTNTVALASETELIWASLRDGDRISGAAASIKAQAISPRRTRPGGRAFDEPVVASVDARGALTRWSPFGFRADALDLRHVVHVGDDGEVLSFEWDKGKLWSDRAEVGSSARAVDRSAFAWSVAGKLFVVGPRRGWSPVAEPREVARASTGPIEDVRVSSTGAVVAVKGANEFELVSPGTPGRIVAYPNARSASTFAVSDDGSLFVVERDGRVVRVSSDDRTRVGPEAAPSGQAWVIGNTLYIAAADRIWTPALELKRTGRYNTVHQNTADSPIDPSGRFYLDFERESVVVRNVQDGNVVSEISNGCSPIASAVFSPSGDFLLVATATDLAASCAPGGFSVVDTQEGRTLFHAKEHAGEVVTDSTGQWIALHIGLQSERLCIEGLHRDRAVVLEALRARSAAIEGARSLLPSETACDALRSPHVD